MPTPSMGVAGQSTHAFRLRATSLNGDTPGAQRPTLQPGHEAHVRPRLDRHPAGLNQQTETEAQLLGRERKLLAYLVERARQHDTARQYLDDPPLRIDRWIHRLVSMLLHIHHNGATPSGGTQQGTPANTRMVRSSIRTAQRP